MAAGFFGDAKLWVPAQPIKDAFYVLGKYVDPLLVQSAFLKTFEVITPVGLSAEDAVRAARLGWKDYEDCLIAICADKAKADYLITRDKRGLDRSPVPVMTPSEWLALMERERNLVYGTVELDG